MAITFRILLPVLIVYLGCDHCSDCKPEKKATTGRNSIKRVLDDYGMYKMQEASGFDKAPVCGRNIFLRDEFRREVNSDNNSTDDIEDDPDLDKVLGGSFATYGEIPWMVNIEYDDEHYCGGAIISEFWVVTAAHCVSNGKKDEYAVTVGDLTLWKKDAFEITYFIDMIAINEGFSMTSFDFDVALIKVKSDKLGRGIKFNNFVQPICLAYATEDPQAGDGIMFAGWGSVLKSDASPILKKGQVSVFDYDSCKKAHPRAVTPNMFCIGDRETGTPAPCHGDSGGPVFFGTNAGTVLFGVISFGIKCVDHKTSEGCMSIPKFRGWIDTQIRKYSVGNQGLMPVRRNWNPM